MLHVVATPIGNLGDLSPRALEAFRAAALIACGIDAADINHRLFNSKSESEIRAEGEISANIRTALGGTLAYATLTKKRRDELGLGEEHFDCAIDVVRALRGARVALFVRETDDGSLRASMRSTGVDVAEVARKFSGGGHVRAAGCSPEAKGVNEAARMIIDEIKRLYGETLL
jgi:phosphoesterase RecJ-like protein